jgi:hypothetical protein
MAFPFARHNIAAVRIQIEYNPGFLFLKLSLHLVDLVLKCMAGISQFFPFPGDKLSDQAAQDIGAYTVQRDFHPFLMAVVGPPLRREFIPGLYDHFNRL